MGNVILLIPKITEINIIVRFIITWLDKNHKYFQDISQEDNESRALTQPADQEAFI